MEIIPEGKNFRLLHDDELNDILEELEKYLPEALKFHQTVKTYLNNRVWQFYFYVSKDWPAQPICLHFPGCTLTPNKRIYESFGIFCPADRLECIEELRGEDILIDWTEPLYLNFTHAAIMQRIEAFYQESVGNVDNLIGDVYLCDEIIAAEPEDAAPLPESEVVMRPLALENVKAIHDLYPASEIECLEVFEKLVASLPGFGIFCVETGTLAAWMVQSYYGAMCSMQTRPEYRRKGYGMHLARALTNLVLKRGYKPFVVIRPENDASKSLYLKLGFRKAFSTVRAILKPYSKPINGDEARENGGDHLEEIDVEVYQHEVEGEQVGVVEVEEKAGDGDEGGGGVKEEIKGPE